MKKTLAFTALTLSFLLLAGASHAARRPAVPAVPAAGMVQRVVERLDLTPEQAEEIRGILVSHQAELAAELARLKLARTHLFETIHAASFDEAAIRNASRAVGQAETELADARAFVEDLLSRLSGI